VGSNLHSDFLQLNSSRFHVSSCTAMHLRRPNQCSKLRFETTNETLGRCEMHIVIVPRHDERHANDALSTCLHEHTPQRSTPPFRTGIGTYLHHQPASPIDTTPASNQKMAGKRKKKRSHASMRCRHTRPSFGRFRRMEMLCELSGRAAERHATSMRHAESGIGQ
jgi:hypothetical protein